MNATRTALKTCILTLIAGSSALLAQDTPDRRLLRAPESEQIAVMKAALDQGFPPASTPELTRLIFFKSGLALPLMERKIEEVLTSPNPSSLFANKAVDAQKFIDRVAWIIADTGDEQSLIQIARLMKLDERRFGALTEIALDHSKRWHNPFVVAYSGFGTTGPEVEHLIIAWAEKNLSIDPDERAREEEAARAYGAPTPPPLADKMRALWAEAMVEHYGGMPTDAQWTSDPIVTRINVPLRQSLHNEILRLAQETIEKRPKK